MLSSLSHRSYQKAFPPTACVAQRDDRLCKLAGRKSRLMEVSQSLFIRCKGSSQDWSGRKMQLGSRLIATAVAASFLSFASTAHALNTMHTKAKPAKQTLKYQLYKRPSVRFNRRVGSNWELVLSCGQAHQIVTFNVIDKQYCNQKLQCTRNLRSFAVKLCSGVSVNVQNQR